MKFQYSEEDLLRGKLVDPDTYLVEIVDVKEGEKTDDDTGDEYQWQSVYMKICGGAFDGVRLQQYGDERYPGLMRGFIEAMTGKELKAGDAVELTKTGLMGKKLKAEVSRGTYTSRKTGKEYPSNQIDAYYPAA
jgi:hypothetical protein